MLMVQALHDANRDGKVGDALQKIEGAVQRIYDPGKF